MPVNSRSLASTEIESASAYLRDLLRNMGLGNMYEWAREELYKGYDDVVVMQHLYEQPEFKERFKAIELLKQAGLPPMSPAQVLDWERQATETAIAAGLPVGFYDDPRDFAELIGRGWSVDEFKYVIGEKFKEAAMAPQSVRDAWRDYFGVDSLHAMASFMLDPDKALPLLETQIQTAAVGGTGYSYGISVDERVAEELARRGITVEQSRQRFQELADTKGLYTENIGEAGTDLRQDREGVAAVFGTDQEDREAVRQRGESRVAAFAGGGGPSVQREGARGLGSAGQPG
jgi:hypothetical protein